MQAIRVWGHNRDWGFRLFLGLALIVCAVIVRPEIAWSSAAVVSIAETDNQACGGNVTGFLGITRIGCSADCTLNYDDATQKWVWSFSVEPQITEIAPKSPAARALHVGDAIVAIDRYLITTMEGGRQFANIAPDRDVTIRYRREGRVEDAVLRAGSRCAPAVEGLKTIPSVETSASSSPSAGSEMASAGISFACGPCSNKSFADGRQEWNFSAPVTVTKVWAGGPAERAGLQSGDLITAVNGNPIESKLGAKSFANLRRSQPTSFTVVRSDGNWQTLTIKPVIIIHLHETMQSTKIDRSGAQKPTGKAVPGVSYGQIGIGLSCRECSTADSPPSGRTLYKFTGPIEVIGLQPGGPAERAGIRKGDRIMAVDDNPIESKKGSEAFSDLRADKPTKFKILRSDGSEVTLTVVPAPRETRENHD